MPLPNTKNETNNYKKQKRWSLIGILSKKKKIKKSQESVDFCPYDGKFNQKVSQNDNLERSTECLIEQYTRSPRQIRRFNSLQHTSPVSEYSNITKPYSLNEWNSSQQSIYSSSSSACYSDIGLYRSCGNSNQSSCYTNEKNEQIFSTPQKVPFRCSSEIGQYENKKNYNQSYRSKSSSNKLIGKKIPPPPPPRDPNIKAVYYFRNNRLMSRESDSTYFSQGSDDDVPDTDKIHENEIEYQNNYYIKEPPRSRRPIQICDIETLSTESKNTAPRIQSVEEAIQELEDIYKSLGLNDEDLMDRAERRDLPTLHQNMRYQSSDELDGVTFSRILPKTRRSGVPDIISDDMAFRKLNKKESKPQSFVSSSFLLVLPTVYNLDKRPKPYREPDITLDDVVFRSRRQRLNFLKISEPQPPFGIPLGPIVGATPSDYLHAVPEGRYKPSFHPRKMPDTVEDDLAFRTLRKDNKYKSCIDYSSVRRNRLKMCDLIPKLNSNRIRNDTHWIMKKAPSDCFDGTKQVKLAFDNLVDSIADSHQNLMVVKIDHHNPIMITGFTVNKVNKLSKSIFKRHILPHESHKTCLIDSTLHYYTPNDAPQLQLKFNRSQYALNRSKSPCENDNVIESTGKNRIEERKSSNFPRVLSTLCNVRCDDRGLLPLIATRRKGVDRDGKNQPNFIELIKREYGLDHGRLHDMPTKDQPSSNFVRPTENRRQQLLRSLRTRACQGDDNDDGIEFRSTTGNYGRLATVGSEIEIFSTPDVGSRENSPENRTEKSSSSSVSADDQYPNSSLPGYLEDGKDVT